jgi:8-oxo-dGTP pyrophosphatase MutT (NUDIX family)
MSTEQITVKLYAKLVVLDQEGRVLCLRRSATHPKKAGRWDLPGGVVSTAKGERPLAAARRETFEETGLKVGTIYAMASHTQLHEADPVTELQGVLFCAAEGCGHSASCHHSHRCSVYGCKCVNEPGKPAQYCMGVIGIARYHGPCSPGYPWRNVSLSREHDQFMWLDARHAALAREVLDSLEPKYRVLVRAAMGTTEPERCACDGRETG